MENKGKSESKILMVADFSEGNKAAIDFVFNYLYNENSEIYLIQTWQKPSYGTSMVRDLSPILKEISTRELKALRTNICEEYKISSSDVKLISFEGELIDFFESENYLKQKWQVVFSIHNLDADLYANPRFKDIIYSVKQPLYVLNGVGIGEKIESVLVKNVGSALSEKILEVLEKICFHQTCHVHVELNVNDITIREKADRVKRYANACKNSSMRFEKLPESIQERQLQNIKPKSLLIYHANNLMVRERKFISYFDKWFVKSKGITVDNF
ncbi:MAG: hypothetical protein N4A59_07595 [Marinifilum sp.]|jgi:hypothetical protein|nr:hypothetical protein [Marinifilum sp.]